MPPLVSGFYVFDSNCVDTLGCVPYSFSQTAAPISGAQKETMHYVLAFEKAYEKSEIKIDEPAQAALAASWAAQVHPVILTRYHGKVITSQLRYHYVGECIRVTVLPVSDIEDAQRRADASEVKADEPDPSAALERAMLGVADAVNEISSEVAFAVVRGERVATLPAEAWEQVADAIKIWKEESRKLLRSIGAVRAA